MTESDWRNSVMLLHDLCCQRCEHVSSSLPSGLTTNVFTSRDTNEATLASAVHGARDDGGTYGRDPRGAHRL